MAAVFLVTVFEYSPLFYISLVSLCFLVTAAMVLGWFGFDVPVILRTSDEPESSSPAPDTPMAQVTNPFALQLGSGPAGLPDGVTLRCCCLEPCVLTCFWGCEVGALQGALQAEQRSSCGLLREVLHPHCHFCQTFHVGKEDGEEHLTQIPADLGITDFGPLPRQHYPLVAVLSGSQSEATHSYSIVASVTVIHVPDDKHLMSARVLFQYLLTSQGRMYELKPLFMSAEGGRGAAPPVAPSDDPCQETRSEELNTTLGDQDLDLDMDQDLDQEQRSSEPLRGCVVCQNAAVNRVLLPCRHACVCDGCASHFQHCPMCRGFILESFTLTQETLHQTTTQDAPCQQTSAGW